MGLDTVGTTAIQVWQDPNPKSFVLEADVANTDNIRVSSKDPTVTQSYISLLPGQLLSFEDFTGSVWIVAKSGTQKWSVEFPHRGRSSKQP